MPVTKSAKRALRSSEKKLKVNRVIMSSLEFALRRAKKTKSKEAVLSAISLADRAAKKAVIHKNKSARIKSVLSKLLAVGKTAAKKKASKKK